MIFKKIEMIGFKSFADRTVIEFNDNFTAIVGPNGCGKSNVSDAIRWVLGEQSPKTLRGDSMQDVIFNGTEKRKSLSYCEVTLTFDNSKRYFNFDYDELAITRKLYRSGESEYLINRNTCHLRDITNLLYNSGLGKNGYSVVSQGKVTELVDAKPESRRAMFEDAAGISKYKNDKREAERKLDRTRDNLTRVKDILTEIDRQLGPLKKQAENAKKYLEYKAQLKDLEVNAYIYQYENANDVKEEINIKLNAIKEELTVRNQELEKANINYDNAMEKLDNFDKSLAKINEEILSLTVQLEKQEGETKLARERINFTLKENDRLQLDLTTSEKALEILEEESSEKSEQLQRFKLHLESLELSFDELSQEYLKVVGELNLSENEAGENQQKIIDALGSLSEIKSDFSRLNTEKELLSQSLENLNKDISLYQTKVIESEKEYKASVNLTEQMENKIHVLKTNAESLAGEIFIQERENREKATLLQNISTQIKVYENRRKLLTDLQTDYEGYSYAIKKLLKESERNAQIKNKIVGVVASLLKVPEKFEAAIEVALGGAVQNIVTFDEEGAKSLIQYLKANQYGRATFLPITSMKPRQIDERLFEKSSGCFGLASKLVDYDKKIENVVSNLLGSTVIVDNLSTAVNLAKSSRYAFRIVTLDGDVVNPQGSLTGGSKKAESANLMGRAREIETLADEIIKLQLKEQALTKEIKECDGKLNSLKNSLKLVNDDKTIEELNLAKELEKQLRFKSDMEDLNDNLSLCRKEAETVANKLKLISEDLAYNEKLESALSGNKIDADELIKQKKERNNLLRADRDKINDNILSVKVEIASKKANIDAINKDIERIENEIGRQKSLQHSAREILEKNKNFISEAEELIKNKLNSAPSSNQKLKLQEIINRRSQIESNKVQLSETIKELDKEKAALMDTISHINDKKYREEINLSKVDSELEQMQERIYEEYSLTYSTCLDLRRPDFEIGQAMIEINKLKKSINALGYVNVNAIEDSKVLLDRYEELYSQSEDLEKAEEDLTKIIKDLSNIMEEKFNNELDRINESFKLTFRELFGGGTAKLALEEGVNPLEAGVEIFAQPPGKKIQNMTLLSGGEKSLTAMAVIFAILRIKPLPFCLFDEVEAALDDSNVEIVDKYLKKLSSATQFILITHKKPTMEYAEALFGVTMEEKGVSKIVSVQLSEAIKQAQEG